MAGSKDKALCFDVWGTLALAVAAFRGSWPSDLTQRAPEGIENEWSRRVRRQMDLWAVDNSSGRSHERSLPSFTGTKTDVRRSSFGLARRVFWMESDRQMNLKLDTERLQALTST